MMLCISRAYSKALSYFISYCTGKQQHIQADYMLQHYIITWCNYTKYSYYAHDCLCTLVPCYLSRSKGFTMV